MVDRGADDDDKGAWAAAADATVELRRPGAAPETGEVAAVDPWAARYTDRSGPIDLPPEVLRAVDVGDAAPTVATGGLDSNPWSGETAPELGIGGGPASGTRLGGYVLRERIAVGGMAEVFRADLER